VPSRPIAPEQVDLRLAWRRVTHDLAARRAFVRHPFLESIIETDLDAWLADISDALTRGTFRAAACRTISVPKPVGHIRPAADLQLSDQVVYAALLQTMRPAIATALDGSIATRDYANHLRGNAGHAEWFEPYFARWRAFDRDSVRSIEEGAEFVVVADVAGFYENIDLNTLRSDLNALGVDSAVLQLLMDCLHRWPRVQRRGVPQGYSPSDVLAKLYLRPVDLVLAAEGFQHRRWVDDFRIFCGTEAEARRGLVVLAETLGRRGLVLQTDKSRILSAAEARNRFTEIRTLLDPIQMAVARELTQEGGSEPSFLPPWTVDEALGGPGGEGALRVLQTAFENYFIAPGTPFNRTLFHFLVRRLGAACDPTYAAAIISFFRIVPEEFDDIAAYCTAVGVGERLEGEFLSVLELGLLPSPYSLYQFLRWRIRDSREPCPMLRTQLRQFAMGPGQHWYVRAVARAALGKFGDPADLESLEAAYADAQSDVERAEILCALRRMERGRRNALYGRAASDGELPSKAVRLARSGRMTWEAC
jgi:hypothetical protein